MQARQSRGVTFKPEQVPTCSSLCSPSSSPAATRRALTSDSSDCSSVFVMLADDSLCDSSKACWQILSKSCATPPDTYTHIRPGQGVHMQRLPASNASSCFAETAVPSFQQLARHKQLGGHKRCKSCTNTETDIVVVKDALLQYNYIVAGFPGTARAYHPQGLCVLQGLLCGTQLLLCLLHDTTTAVDSHWQPKSTGPCSLERLQRYSTI